MQLHLHGFVAGAQGQDGGVEIAQRGPVHVRQPHRSGNRCPAALDRPDIERPAAHFGGLSQERQAQTDGFFPAALARETPGEDALQCLAVHATTIVADANDQPVVLDALDHRDLDVARSGGERVHRDVQNV